MPGSTFAPKERAMAIGSSISLNCRRRKIHSSRSSWLMSLALGERVSTESTRRPSQSSGSRTRLCVVELIAGFLFFFAKTMSERFAFFILLPLFVGSVRSPPRSNLGTDSPGAFQRRRIVAAGIRARTALRMFASAHPAHRPDHSIRLGERADRAAGDRRVLRFEKRVEALAAPADLLAQPVQ